MSKCHKCDRNYRIDVLLPDYIWEMANLGPLDMVCGECIMRRLETFAAKEDKHGYMIVHEAEMA